jgi:hypothetical protein
MTQCVGKEVMLHARSNDAVAAEVEEEWDLQRSERSMGILNMMRTKGGLGG